MASYARDRVVVGVDVALEQQPPVDAAVNEARWRGAGLAIVHVFERPQDLGRQLWTRGVDEGVRVSAAALEGLADEVRARNPDLDVSSSLIVGSPSSVLLQASVEARLIVLGCRGMGGFEELLLGSVSSQVSAHARCPVLVIRPAQGSPPDPAGPVLVGVDGSPGSEAAVEFAFTEAAQRGVPLVALHYWVPRAGVGGEYGHGSMIAEEDEARRFLAEAVSGWAAKYPEVVVEERAVLDTYPEGGFVNASASASLVVVGSRGRGGLTGRLMGSVSQALLHHGHCPIAVVHP